MPAVSRYAKNAEHNRRYQREWFARVRLAALAFYSDGTMQCRECGYSTVDALVLDHVGNDGANHRRALGRDARGRYGMNIFATLRARGFPPGFQVLCHNCNWLKELDCRRARR